MSNKISTITHETSSVNITIPRESFGEFIKDLISNKRSFGRDFDHIFWIDKNNITDIYNIIDYRVREQADAHLVSVEISSRFANGSYRKYDSLEAFNALNDLMDSLSETVFMR